MIKDLKQYSKYLINQKRQAPATVKAYTKDIRSFLDFSEKVFGGYQSLYNITSDDAKKYHQTMIDLGKHKSTINHTMTSLRLFFDYLIILNKVKFNPFREINHFETHREVPAVLSDEEVARLIGAPMREYQVLIETLVGNRPRRYGNLIFLRDQLILEILYYSGPKLSELVELRDTDIDCRSMLVNIKGKKGYNKDRSIQVPECVIITFEEYIRLRDKQWPEKTWNTNPYVFLNKFGKQISHRSVRRMIAEYAQKSGLHPGISPETIRATFGLKAIRNGANAETIQYLLGFADLSTAESYVTRFNSWLVEPKDDNSRT